MSIEWNGELPKINADTIKNLKLETTNNKSKLDSIFNGKNIKQLPIDITHEINHTNDNAFDIPIDERGHIKKFTKEELEKAVKNIDFEKLKDNLKGFEQ